MENKLKELLESPTQIDLLRFRQLDMETIKGNDKLQNDLRMDFLTKLSNSDVKKQYIWTNCLGDDKMKKKLYSLVKSKNLYIKSI